MKPSWMDHFGSFDRVHVDGCFLNGPERAEGDSKGRIPFACLLKVFNVLQQLYLLRMLDIYYIYNRYQAFSRGITVEVH